MVDRRPAYRPPVVERRAEPAEWDEYASDWREPSRRPFRKGRWITAAAALAVLAAGGGAVAGANTESATARWQGVTDVAAATPVLPGLVDAAPKPSAAGVAAAVQGLVADSRLGGHVTASVIDVTTGEQLFDKDGAGQAIPASTAKLLTAAAVLQSRGPAYRIPTRAVAGASPGEVVLIGGGDPTLAATANTSYAGAARLDVLAGQVAKALGGQAPTKVIYDSSLYSGPTLSPNWYEADATAGFIANITALMTDGARKDPRKLANPSARYPQPDVAAAQGFAAALGLPATAVSAGTAPPGAAQLGEVQSPPVSRMVEMMLSESDNIIAEGMARQVAIAKGKPASFDGAAEATKGVLTDLGVPMSAFSLVDGSGLSHADKVSAQLLTAIIAKAASPDYPQLRSILSGLPVAAYSGTLAERFASANAGKSGAGIVRAKTGTLNNVNTLAGLAVDADGRLLAFSVVADSTPKSAPAEAALDRVAAAVAGCGCA
jgi:D-alanyl-D-alanine carboxypeptidase/D-alanyl-D-alanine-endopeptidase (penicillin-binding protein 4)